MAMHADWKGRLASGLRWSAVARVLQQALQYLTLFLLARRLGPGPYGLVGMVQVFSGFSGTLAEFGLGSAVVQNKDLSEDQISSIFWVNVIAGFGLYGAFFALAPWISDFYHGAPVVAIARALGIVFVAGSLGIVPRAVLQRRMEFRPIALADLGSSIVGNALSIALVLLHAGVYAIVAGTVATPVVASIALLGAARYRPRFTLALGSLRSPLGYGGKLVGFQLVNYWSRNADNLIVGRLLGTTALGLYTRAYSLMLLPVTQVIALVSSVMFTALCAIQDDKPRAKALYLRATTLIVIVSFPMMTGLFVVAEPLVLVTMGPSWLGIVPVLRIFCILGLMQTVGAPLGWIFTSQGRTDLMLYWGLCSGVAIVLSFVVGALFGSITAIAWAYLTVTTLLFWPAVHLPGRLLGIRVADILRAIATPAACSLAMAAAVWGVARVLSTTWRPWTALMAEVGVGVAIYGALLKVANPAALADLPAILPTWVMGRWRRAWSMR
jgi:PST family polysaccharide transporter